MLPYKAIHMQYYWLQNYHDYEKSNEKCNANLLSNIITCRTKKLHKHGNGTMINNNSRMLWCPRCNIGQSPCSLKLHMKGNDCYMRLYSSYTVRNGRIIQAFHTCNWGRSCLPRNSTNRGTTPALITSSIGGLRSAQLCSKVTKYVNINRHTLLCKSMS